MTLCAAQCTRTPISPSNVDICPLKSINPPIWADPFNRNDKRDGILGRGTGWEFHLDIHQDTFFFLFKTNRKTQSLVEHLTLDDEFAVLISRVFHGVKGLLGDAVEVHVPPVFQHLECDVCTVDHCSRCL